MGRIAKSLFLGALLLLAFVAGSTTDVGRDLIAAAATALRGAWQGAVPPTLWADGHGFVNIAAADAATQRVQLLAPTLAGSVLVAGGRHRFLDRCPGFVGCVAVEYDRHGRFVHAYPFRPEAFEAALVPDGLALPVGYELAVGFDFAKHADVLAIDSYSNGDLAVVFHTLLGLPPAPGIARIDRDGWPRWFRADGSHHWPAVAHGRLRGAGAGLRDAVVVPGWRVGDGWPPGARERKWDMRMGRGQCAKHFVDYLRVIDGDGALLWQLSVVEVLANSRYAPILAYSHDACDPVHVNSVEVLTATGPSGLAAGDFLLSMRGMGALAVLDGGDGRVKRIWRGSFFGQHGARELARPAGPTFLLYDNWGREGEYGPGRLLALEPHSGRERTIFPNASSQAVGIRSSARGGVSVAADGSRAIVHAHGAGQAVEVDLASGETTAIFQVLDDVSALAAAVDQPGQAYRWKMTDVRYVSAGAGAVRQD